MESPSSLASDSKSGIIGKARSDSSIEVCPQHGTPVTISMLHVPGKTYTTRSGCAACEESAATAERIREEQRRTTAFRTAQQDAKVPARYRNACLEPFPISAPGQEIVVAQ